MISPARKIAYQILLRVEAGRGFAVDLLQSPEVSALKYVDRRLAMEIVMGVLRWRGYLDFRIERLSGKKLKILDAEVLTILRMGIYQIRFLERVPKRAVVDDAVELTKAARKRSAAGFVNAVLRKCDAPGDSLLGRDFEDLSPDQRESVRRAFPEWLLKRWENSNAYTCEPDEIAALRLAFASLLAPRTTLRVVDIGVDLEVVRRELAAEGVATLYCEFAEQGLEVESGLVQNTRAYREGRVVIQDEASQLVAELVAPKPGERVLDVCAAPGMKAGQLAQALGSGTLIACDHSRARLRTMAALLPKWIPPQVHFSLVRLDASSELPFAAKFDRILVDAPCSGTGTLARNPEIKWRLHPEDITRLAELQAKILRNALQVLASGGRLVYATCSIEMDENERVVERVLREEPGFRTLSSAEIHSTCPRLSPVFISSAGELGQFRTRPHQHSMDGFNAAVIVRKGNLSQ